MLKKRYVKKSADGACCLDVKGLQLAERATPDDLRARRRPKLSVTFLLTNGRGEIAVWTRLCSRISIRSIYQTAKYVFDDPSAMDGAERILLGCCTKLPGAMKLVGTAEVTTTQGGEALVHVLHQIVRATIDPADIFIAI